MIRRFTSTGSRRILRSRAGLVGVSTSTTTTTTTTTAAAASAVVVVVAEALTGFSSGLSSSAALRYPRRSLWSHSRPCWVSSSSSSSPPPSDSSPSSDGTPAAAAAATTLDYTTRARGFGGKYSMAEKLAEAQEQVQALPPHLRNNASSAHRCCVEGGDCDDPHQQGSSLHHSPTATAAAAAEDSTTMRPILPAPLPKPISQQSVEEEAVRAAAHAAAQAASGGNGPVDQSIESLLVRSTIESIRSSSEFRMIPKGAAHRGIKRLLDYNKQWAVEVSRCNPTYFADLATEQKPEYLWIGCSDSRVPANEIVGLHPGDVFVHRNIGNIFSLSDLNCLSALQFAVDCLKVEHVIVAGHYKCGGVTAAMQGQKLGLTEHWIMQVTDIKNRWWHRVVNEIHERDHLNVLCELNVLEQLYHVVSCCVIQRRWNELNLMESGPDTEDKAHILVRREYQRKRPIFEKNHPDTTARVFSKVAKPVDVEVHGWVYSLDDGMLRPILRLTRQCNVEKAVNAAREAIFVRYSLSS